MQISHEVYINAIKIAIPAALGQLTAVSLAKLERNNGSAYTEDYNVCLSMLTLRRVEDTLLEFADDVASDLQISARALGVNLSRMTLRQIAR